LEVPITTKNIQLQGWLQNLSFSPYDNFVCNNIFAQVFAKLLNNMDCFQACKHK
jgi:hypothetical protein